MTSYRLAIIADIHGILPSLQAVLSDIQSNPPDEIVVAGDFLGAPQPLEALSLLQSLGCQFILGNGEARLLRMYHGTAPSEWWTHHQFDMGRWIFNRLTTPVFDFLETVPEQLLISPPGCEPVRVVHGSPWDINKLIFPNQEPETMQRALEMIQEKTLVFAHNHLPAVVWCRSKLAVNPGSVSNNLNGDTRASYATLTWKETGWEPSIHYVPYDLNLVKKSFEQTGFLNANRQLGRAFLESIFTGENTALDYIQFAEGLAKRAGLDVKNAIPDEIWLGAEGAFPWQFDF